MCSPKNQMNYLEIFRGNNRSLYSPTNLRNKLKVTQFLIGWHGFKFSQSVALLLLSLEYLSFKDLQNSWKLLMITALEFCLKNLDIITGPGVLPKKSWYYYGPWIFAWKILNLLRALDFCLKNLDIITGPGFLPEKNLDIITGPGVLLENSWYYYGPWIFAW